MQATLGINSPCNFTARPVFWPDFPYAKGAHNIPVVIVAVKLDADRFLVIPYARGAHNIHVGTMVVKLDAERPLDVIRVSIHYATASTLRQDKPHTRSHKAYQQLLCAMCRQCSTHPQPHITKQTSTGLLSAAFRQRGHV